MTARDGSGGWGSRRRPWGSEGWGRVRGRSASVHGCDVAVRAHEHGAVVWYAVGAAGRVGGVDDRVDVLRPVRRMGVRGDAAAEGQQRPVRAAEDVTQAGR